MNIFTERVKNQHYSQPIQASLLKHSQEYRVLATLRYLFPQKYNKMAAKESPDLQDFENSIGVEVTAAVREDDMRATRAFSQFCRASSNRERQKNKTQIESSGYSIVPIQGSRLAISTTGTSNGEKNFFQKNVREKIACFERVMTCLTLFMYFLLGFVFIMMLRQIISKSNRYLVKNILCFVQ